MVWLYRSPIPVGRREVFSCSNYFYLPSRRIKGGGGGESIPCVLHMYESIIYFSDLVDFSYIDQLDLSLEVYVSNSRWNNKGGEGHNIL